MDAAMLVRSLRDRGVTLEAAGDKLRLTPASMLTPAEMDAVRALKPAILRILASAPSDPCPACGGAQWWRRPTDGGWVCNVCHPDPSAPMREPVDAVLAARDARSAWTGAVFELAELLDWPRMDVRQGVHVGPGEVPWRLYLRYATLPELRDMVLPALRAMLDALGRPREAA